MKTRLVVIYKLIDENDNVISEFQHKILDEQEHHPYRHHTQQNQIPPADNAGTGEEVGVGSGSNTSNEVNNDPPAPEFIDLTIGYDLEDADYTGSDFMARVCANADDGFNNKPWLANGGGWYNSESHTLVVPVQTNKDYFVRLACATIAANENITISEDGVVAADWQKELICNGQLAVYTKQFSGVDTFPVLNFKNY